MIFHYAGRYDGDESKLPMREHIPNAVPFQEVESMKDLARISNIGAIMITVILGIPFVALGGKYIYEHSLDMMIGTICIIFTFIPHELLHAICFKKDVYMYHYFRRGILFVAGTEDMSKQRFIFLSLLPNIVFGFCPYLIFLFSPHHLGLGIFGLTCTAMGIGDYINVYNAMKQMPKGARTYMCGMHSYWYLVNEETI